MTMNFQQDQNHPYRIRKDDDEDHSISQQSFSFTQMLINRLLRFPGNICLWGVLIGLFLIHLSSASFIPKVNISIYPSNENMKNIGSLSSAASQQQIQPKAPPIQVSQNADPSTPISKHTQPTKGSKPSQPLKPAIDQTTATPASCDGISYANNLPDGFEPSDLAFDPVLKRIYCVSDGGILAAFRIDGGVVETWEIPGSPDLEGVALIPSRPSKIYLAQEFPPAVLEFDLTSQKLAVVVELPEIESLPSTADSGFDGLKKRKRKADGIESIAYFRLPLNQGQSPVDVFIIGRQTDAALFFYRINGENDGTQPISLQYLGYQAGIGTQHDLSALTFWKNRLWALFDKDMELLAFTTSSLSTLETDPSKADSVTPPVEDKAVGTFSFEIRGQEGIVFAKDEDGKEYVFIAVDAPHKSGRKDLLRYTVQDFFVCFAPFGIKSIPSS